VLDQEGGLRRGLDAFGHHDQAEALADVQHRRGQGLRHREVFDVVHETAIELELAQRQPMQVAQAGLAVAEIVHRQPDAQRLQRPQLVERVGAAVDPGRFGQFERQLIAAQAVPIQQLTHPRRQAGILEVARRQVDGHTRHVDAVGAPAGQLGAGGFEHPVRQLVHQARLFGDRDETLG